MAGKPLSDFDLHDKPYDHIAVKGSRLPVRPFPRRRHRAGPGDALHRRGHGPWTGVRPGETLAPAFARAFAKSQLGRRHRPADQGLRLRLGEGSRQAVDRRAGEAAARPAASRCWRPAAPPPTWRGQGLKVEHVKKVLEGRPHIVDAMKNGEVQLVFNTTEGKQFAGRQLRAAPHRPDDEDALLHDGRRRPRRPPRPSSSAPRLRWKCARYRATRELGPTSPALAAGGGPRIYRRSTHGAFEHQQALHRRAQRPGTKLSSRASAQSGKAASAWPVTIWTCIAATSR